MFRVYRDKYPCLAWKINQPLPKPQPQTQPKTTNCIIVTLHPSPSSSCAEVTLISDSSSCAGMGRFIGLKQTRVDIVRLLVPAN